MYIVEIFLVINLKILKKYEVQICADSYCSFVRRIG